MSSFANRFNGRIEENKPFISWLSLSQSYLEKLMDMAPTSYYLLTEEEFKALFYPHPCTAWGVGLVILTLTLTLTLTLLGA